MVVGEEKRIICLRGEKNAAYDEVFFILRDGGVQPRERDMLREANRILEESMRRGEKKRKKNCWFSLLSFLAGSLSAAGLSFLLVLVL